MLKGVILIGGPQKGTRFRPLSLDVPKPLFPVAGLPIIQHHVEACVSSQISEFISDMQHEYQIKIRYLQEFTALGTAGGMYHFRDLIRGGSPEAFFILNGDVCADFPLQKLLEFHKKQNNALATIMGTEATKEQAINYGCLVMDKM
ncbi:mannose-1-phosphate guanyltransferase alpha-like [Ctenocephalides felis]|uniref:mannose-1-phosphate guanyltransferase alpha-like n=1 Tax=Ctenocephalides felis TaxID=7515 RepID=UPI000E6E1A77|nr:mannose-1-phosphate guanyltransferase alpha-like [Ctenocephalides felis]